MPGGMPGAPAEPPQEPPTEAERLIDLAIKQVAGLKSVSADVTQRVEMLKQKFDLKGKYLKGPSSRIYLKLTIAGLPEDYVKAFFKKVYDLGLPMNAHANGDAAVDLLLRAHEFEVVVRDQLARQIAFPLDAQDLVFELHQPAGFQAQLP